MKALCNYARWVAALIFVTLGSGLATNARAQCASVSATPVNIAYNPLSGSDSVTQFTVTVTNNTCGPNTSIEYGVSKGPVDQSGQGTVLPEYPLAFSSTLIRVANPSLVIPLDNAIPGRTGNSPSLSNGQSAARVFTFNISARQSITPGSIIPFVLYARSSGQITNSEQTGTINVQSGFMMTVAGAGSSGTLDFGTLEVAEPSQSINIHAQATGAYRVTLASEQNGVLRNTALGAETYTVPYAVTLGGALISESTPYQASTTSGTILLNQGTAILPLIIDPDTSGVAGLRAGIYRDILTLTISAAP